MSRQRRRRRSEMRDAAQRRQGASLAGWLFLGLVLGLVGGLLYAWLLNPVEFTDATPARLGAAERAQYIELVSQSFLATGDWATAERRLVALEDEQIGQTVADLLEAAIQAQEPDRTIRSLAALAQQLGMTGRAVTLFAPTPATPVPSTTPTQTAVPFITVTPSPTPMETAVPTAVATETAVVTATAQPNYRLLNQERVCGDEPIARLEVEVLDTLLNPQPGVEVQVRWAEGQDRFFTGFKPEQGLGYADFTMVAGVSYTAVLPDGSQEVSGLRIEPCANGVAGGWRLTFQNLRTAGGEN